MTLPLTSASQREVDVLGLFRYRDTYPMAIDLMSSNKVLLLLVVVVVTVFVVLIVSIDVVIVALTHLLFFLFFFVLFFLLLKVELMSMVTHRFGFTQEDVMKGFEVAGSGRDGAIKVMFRLDSGSKL